jgi:hypothetical protein
VISPSDRDPFPWEDGFGCPPKGDFARWLESEPPFTGWVRVIPPGGVADQRKKNKSESI